MSRFIDGKQMRKAFCFAADKLQEKQERLNRMNLFPVADRDTGINMALSMKKTCQCLRQDGTPFEIAEDAYMQLLEYAHGNSGNILTLIFEGFAYGLPEGESQISGRHLAAAFLRAAENAVRGIADPMDGTILTVVQQSAQAGSSLAEVCDDAGMILLRIAEEARAALLLTPLQNPVLRPYRVVDSGAYGFCLILDGFVSSVFPEAEEPFYPDLQMPDRPLLPEGDIRFPYCTEFLLEPFPAADMETMAARLRPLGDSFICAGTETLRKIHIHTDSPDSVLQTAADFGEIRSQKIDDMRELHII